MKFEFHPEAETELLAAIDYYESLEAGLGEDFATEVFGSIGNILSYPAAWPILESEVHRCLVNRFPYGILYSIEPDHIFILAVMNLHRHPDHWKSRQ